MVVKVVSDKPVRTKKVICPKCGYELEYTGEDVREYEHRDYTGGSDTVYQIVCPRTTCNKIIYLSYKDAH